MGFLSAVYEAVQDFLLTRLIKFHSQFGAIRSSDIAIAKFLMKDPFSDFELGGFGFGGAASSAPFDVFGRAAITLIFILLEPLPPWGDAAGLRGIETAREIIRNPFRDAAAAV